MILDVENVFRYPVIQIYPAIASSYVKFIEKPMDFETIKQERLQDYVQITDLQEDLELIFKNCCRYNEEKSALWCYAM